MGLNNQHFDSKRHIWGQNDLEKNLYIAKRRDYKRSGFGELRQRHLTFEQDIPRRQIQLTSAKVAQRTPIVTPANWHWSDTRGQRAWVPE